MEQTNINLNAAKLPTMTCRCGNFTFQASFVLKRISALLSPTGKETMAPIQVFTCTHCGTILPVGGDDSLDFISDLRDGEPQEEKSNVIELAKR